jgi:hypothetical protein
MQIVAEICQNRTTGKYRFFQKSSIAQIKKCKTKESWIITWGMCTKKLQINTMFWDFSQIFTAKRRNLFWDNNFPKSYLLPIRGYSWHQNKIKLIRRGDYSSNNFQDSTKRKSTKRKHGLSPKSAFL